ncbi:MAG: hypothetical protein ACYDA4_15810 [Ignavibacteriaceae bacterium]
MEISNIKEWSKIIDKKTAKLIIKQSEEIANNGDRKNLMEYDSNEIIKFGDTIIKKISEALDLDYNANLSFEGYAKCKKQYSLYIKKNGERDILKEISIIIGYKGGLHKIAGVYLEPISCLKINGHEISPDQNPSEEWFAKMVISFYVVTMNGWW